MQKNNLFFYLIVLIFTYSCANQDNGESVLEQANEIHLEAIKIDKTVKPKMKEMIQSKNQIKAQGEELSAEKETFVEKVEQLEKSYAYWEENHVEVPGFEHHGHSHDHDHSHDHSTTLEVSPEDMLLIQQEFKDSISVILERLEAITLPIGIQ